MLSRTGYPTNRFLFVDLGSRMSRRRCLQNRIDHLAYLGIGFVSIILEEISLLFAMCLLQIELERKHTHQKR